MEGLSSVEKGVMKGDKKGARLNFFSASTHCFFIVLVDDEAGKAQKSCQHC